MDNSNVMFEQALANANLAKNLDENKRKEIASEVIAMYELDELSRKSWLEKNDQWMKLALQTIEGKEFPWRNASNVKFPLLTIAALQFASRAYPALVNSSNIVKVKVFGKDDTGEKAQQADTISLHMSYQILHEMEGWEEDMDKLVYVLPIIGTCFKKVYFDPIAKINRSELVFPKDLVINYWATNLANARKTHRLWLTGNTIREYINDGFYLDEDGVTEPGTLSNLVNNSVDHTNNQVIDSSDKYTPRLVLEQHTLLDLDDDGYAEPYIITVDKESGKLLRIGARFRKEDVVFDDKQKIKSIKPCEYFIKYGFLPNPDGGFYNVGFGILLGAVNEALNTLINQLIDSGTLNTLQAGFISKGIRINRGPMGIAPGEWVSVNNFGDDLKKGIFPLPTKEPSAVLFNLLGVLAQTGKEIASVSEVFTGKFPGQNTPASTTSAVIEEGMKVFTSIHKRIHRDLGKEFKLLYKLNKLYLPRRVEFTLPLAGTDASKTNVVGVNDYAELPLQGEAKGGESFVSVIPASDPSMINDSQKVLKTQQLLELQGNLRTLNPMEITKVALENIDIANKQALMTPPPKEGPSEIELKLMEIQEVQRSNKANEQLAYMKEMSESLKRQSEVTLNLAKAEQLGDTAAIEQYKIEAERIKTQEESFRRMIELAFKQEEHSMQMQQKQDEHSMNMSQTSALNAQTLVHNERLATAKEKSMNKETNEKK